uniref:Uncharacterized protein n=1 Tax=Setaria italica TaxID=4555 RepID=K3Y384_SETIT
MHDLVHELARSVAIEEVAICDGKQGSFGPKKDNYRYTLLLNFKGQHPKCKDMPFKARAAHFSGCTGCQPSKGAFSETKWLRVLDFPRMQTVELPSSMENLHHLQFLNLSENTSLKKLHSSFSKKVKLHSSTSICDFQKLHYLDLHGCSNLSELPGPIHRLQVLEHLDLSGCTSLQKLPSQFGELQKLSFLNLSCCSKLEMLPDSFSLLKNLEHLNLSSCCQLKQLRTLSFKRMKGLLYLNLSGCTCLEALPEFCVGNDGCLNLEILDLSDCGRLIDLSESCARLNKLRFLNLSGCPCIPKIICFLSKFVNLEYLNLSALSGFDVRKDSEAPSSSTQHSSDYSGEELSLKMLHDTLKNMHCLEYLSVGGMSLFSKEGISSDLLTLPDFVVSERGSGDCSNIILLQNILDSTNSELNIKCLEVVTSAEEAKGVQLGRRHRLASLSLEWSSLEWSEEPQVTTRDVLENLKPHPALKHLTIKGYNYSMFPSWMREICSTLPNLVKLVLSDLVECDQLPTLGNLSNLQELEIRNMPKLMEACLAPCRNLKRLSLVELAFGCTLWFCQDGSALRTNRSSEEIHDMELDPSEEFKRLEVFRTQSGDPSRGKGKAKFTAMTRNMMETLLGVTKKRTQMTHVPVSSSAPCPAKEAFPPLCYLKIEHCNYLKLKPRIPNSQEFFINESSIPTLTRINSDDLEFFVNELSIPTLTRINSGDLVIEQTIQKLKISNCKSFDLQKLPGIQSVHELEIDCLEKFHRFYELRCMDRLVKLTLSSPENFLHTDKAEILKAIPQIQCIKINGVISLEGYRDATFCGWMSDPNLYLPNLVKIELMGMPRCARLPSLGQLANLEELHISDMPNIREVDTSFYGGRDPFRKLRELCINKMENLEVLSTNLELSAGEMSWDDDEQKVQGDEIFPRLAHLVVTGCPRLTLGSAFQGYIGRIVASCSEVELSPGILVGSSHLFRLEVESNIFGFSDASEFLQYSTDLRNLTIKSDSDLITLPEIIRSCHSLRSLQILDSCNFAALPDWLGDLASLEELEVHSAKLQRLPHSIKNVTSLRTLTLKKCNYKLRECCSRLGEDYDKIKHIKHVDAHE